MKKSAQIIAVLVIGLLGVIIFSLLVATKPEASTITKEKILPVVKMWRAQSGEHQVIIQTQGVVEPIQITALASEVSGKIEYLSPNFEVGQRFKKDEVLLSIDASDYEAVQAKAMAELADAKLALSKETALSEQALRDWKALGEGEEPNELVLRKPQLESALARVVSAKAGVEKAERDLEKTKIKSPYDSKIEKTNVELGSLISQGSVVGSVYSADRFELRLPVSINEYDFVDIDKSAEVIFETNISGTRYSWNGKLLRSESKVDQSSQSIFLVAEIQNSLLNKKFLVPGVYLKAKVFGKVLKKTYSIPRAAIFDRNKLIVILEGNSISIREVKIVRSERDVVIISSGIEDGDRVVTTPLSNAIEGMKVEVYQD